MAPVTAALPWITGLLFVFLLEMISADHKNITAESGQSVTLPFPAPNNNITVVECSRADLETEYVFVYRNEKPDLENQHPSFKNRVDLQDRQMKDGDVSLILKDVTINDTGTYECRVFMEETQSWEHSGIIYLSVVDPPGHTGGTTEDGEEEDVVNRGHSALVAGLSAFVVICVAVAAFIFGKLTNSNLSLS